jgi:hypothetical protein
MLGDGRWINIGGNQPVKASLFHILSDFFNTPPRAVVLRMLLVTQMILIRTGMVDNLFG